MKSKLFDIQPIHCRLPLDLSNVDLSELNPIPKRVLQYNPTPLYERINEANLLNPFKRQCTVSMTFLFKNENNKCACGCGAELSGRRKRWATNDCSNFALAIFYIISGRVDSLRFYRSRFIGGLCCEICGISEFTEPLELDHLHPVAFGGGGGWLSNYQFKCKPCHRVKTNKDFGFNTTKPH